MALPTFQWGAGGQAITTPEQAARRRSVAESLMAQSATPGRNWAEGLADVAAALSGANLENRVTDAETAGRERAGGLFANLAVNSTPDSIIAALTSPDSAWASPAQTSIASALLQSGLERADPMYQLQLQTAQAELDALRNPGAAGLINAGNGNIYDPNSQSWITAPNGGGMDLPADVQEYNWYADAEASAGRQPLSYLDFFNAQRGAGLSVTTNPDGTTTVTQGGPNRPLTEAQSKDTVYATRAAGALPVLDQLGSNLTDPVQRAVEGDPTGLVRGNVQSPEFQQANQAGLEFLQAILRKDTGAAITAEEQNQYGRVYLPQPGDSDQVLEQKRVSRQRALAAIEAGIPPQGILNQERALLETGQPNADGVPSFASQAEYDAAPSGTRFRAPDGSIRVKP